MDPDDTQPQENEIDPIEKQKMEDALRERISKYLKKKHGFEDDEMKTLFPTLEKLTEFYKEMRSLSNTDDDHLDDGAPGKAPADSEKDILPDQARRAQELTGKPRKLSPKNKAKFEQAMKKLPAEAQAALPLDEYEQLMRDIGEVDTEGL